MLNIPPHRQVTALVTGTLALLVVALSSCSIIAPERVTETRTLAHTTNTAPTMLRVVAQDGSIDVIEDATIKNISVTAKVTAGGKTIEEAQARLKGTKIEITEPSEGEVSIKATWPTPFSQADEVSFAVRIPDLKAFDGRSSNGRINVAGADGPITILTSNGDVAVSGSRQVLAVKTSNGDVDVQDHVGDVKIETSNGTVDIANLNGGASVRTSNSRVTIDLNDDATKPIKVRTSNDDINLTCGTSWNGIIEADTSNDGIRIESAAGRISSQSIRDSSGSITVGSGGETSRLETSNDVIRITIR